MSIMHGTFAHTWLLLTRHLSMLSNMTCAHSVLSCGTALDGAQVTHLSNTAAAGSVSQSASMLHQHFDMADAVLMLLLMHFLKMSCCDAETNLPFDDAVKFHRVEARSWNRSCCQPCDPVSDARLKQPVEMCFAFTTC